jgi:hypothetical protein
MFELKMMINKAYTVDIGRLFYLISSLFCLFVFIFSPLVSAFCAATLIGVKGVPPGRLSLSSLIFVLTMFLGFSFTMASRIPSLGSADDTYNYWLYYLSVLDQDNSFLNYFKLDSTIIEPGFTLFLSLISFIFGELAFDSFRFLFSFIITGIYTLSLVRVTRNINSPVFRGMCIAFGFILYGPILPMQLMRQHLASLIILFGIINPFFHKRMVFYFVGFLFHYSTLPIIIIYEIGRKFGSLILIIAPVIVIFYQATLMSFLPENYSYIAGREDISNSINEGALNYILLVACFAWIGLVSSNRRHKASLNLEFFGGIYVVLSFLIVFYMFYNFSNLSLRATYLYSALLLGPILACFVSVASASERVLALTALSCFQVFMISKNFGSGILWHYWDPFSFVPFHHVYEMFSIILDY